MSDLIAEAPQPPEVPPQLRFHKVELAGIGVIALLPVAAVLGAFGPTMGHERAQAGEVRVEAEYPTRLRTAMSERISVRLTNQAQRPVTGLVVRFDPEFLHAFSELGFSPEAERPYVVEVPEIEPGETRLIEVEVHAKNYGLHEGRIAVEAQDASGSFPVRTLIFP